MSNRALLSELVQSVASATNPRAALAQLLFALSDTLGESDALSRLATELAFAARQLGERNPARTLREEVDLLRERLVHEALSITDNNVALAARRLGVSRNLIYAIVARSKNASFDREC